MNNSARSDLFRKDLDARRVLISLPVTDVLLVAPPGCGKTEGLADRAEALLSQRLIERPQRLLALTFSNRARNNLRDRLNRKLGARQTLISVTNLHGLSARLIRAHGALLDLDGEWGWPQKGWRAQAWRSVVGGDGGRIDPAERVLRVVKSRPRSDDEVMDELKKAGNPDAIEFEHGRIEDHRFDYQDLLRHAHRLLEIDDCRETYREHFGAVLLDEAQDLTHQQLDIALAIGSGRMTSAADEEQGIYGFRGANAEEVVERLRASDPVEIQFHRSFRSAEAVLRCVNQLTYRGTVLVAADPSTWADEGSVCVARSATKDEEAECLITVIQRIVEADDDSRVGVISRTRYRRDAFLDRLTAVDFPIHVWDRPTDNPTLGRLLRGCLRDVRNESDDDGELLTALMALARARVDPADAELLDQLVEVGIVLQDLLGEISLEEAVARCQVTHAGEAVPPGLNVLTGHEGKGQQFDWVFVLGVEEGVIPDYRARDTDALDEEKRLLRVMASRARYGLVFSLVAGWPTRYGWRKQDESRWIPLVEEVATHRLEDLEVLTGEAVALE